MVREAMDPPRAAARTQWWPAMAAAVTLAVGIGIWFAGDREDGSDTSLVAQQNPVPELYEDLDFYLWLAEERDEQSKS